MDLIRQLPYSLEAEQSVLGSVIIDPACLNEVLGALKAEHFYVPHHVNIFKAMSEMNLANEPIDHVTLIEKLKTDGVFEEIGGKEYILKLANTVPSSASVIKYAQIIKEKSVLRGLIEAASKITDMCYEGTDNTSAILDRAEQLIYGISDNRGVQDFVHIKDAVSDTLSEVNQIAESGVSAGLPTYFGDLDNMIVGLNSTDLLLLAARPAMGKTSFALNIAYNIAKNSKKAVAIFSLEMEVYQLVERMLSTEAMVDSRKLRSGELSDDEWSRLLGAGSAVSKTDIYLAKAGGITVSEMKARCRRVKNLGLIVVDYLQLMESAGDGKNHGDRVQEVSAISRGLKLMATDLGVPVVALSQLNRKNEDRTDKRPMMSDLRESGAIEQDADIIMFLYRDDVYNKNTERRNICECIVAKNRHGSTGMAEFAWTPEFTKFTPLEKRHEEA